MTLPRSQQIARLCGAVIFVGSLVVLLGWVFGIDVLTRVLPHLVAMNPFTAVCFLGLGLAILALTTEEYQTRWRRFVICGALAVAAVGLIKLSSYAFDWNLDFDRLLFQNVLGDNQMAPNTALCFLLIGAALVTLDWRLPRGAWLGECLVLLTAAYSLLSLVGYGYGAERMYRVSIFIPMALNTAIFFQVVAFGLLATRPRRGVMGLIASPGLGGMLARRLLPAAIATPCLLGWLRLLGERLDWYDTAFGTALSMAGTIVMLTLLIGWSAFKLNQVDQERQRASASLKLASDEIFDLYNQAPCGYHSLNSEGKFTAINATELAWLGYTSDEVLGKLRFSEIIVPEQRRLFEESFEKFKHKGSASDLEFSLLRKDGGEIPVMLNASAIYDAEGRYLASRSTVFNATERKRAQRAMQQLNESLEERVVARTAELARVNSELTQKNQENAMFVYSVSHDLRSPLVNLQGFSRELSMVSEEIREILVENELPDDVRSRGLRLVNDDMGQSIQFIQSAVSRLSGIIDALLRLSRVGRIEYQPQAVDLNPMLTRIVEATSGTIFDCGAQVVIEELPPAWGDATALEQVFSNLVGNALKYLDPQRPGEIVVGYVATSESGNWNIYRVADNGVGIDKSHHDKAFQAFKRLHPEMAPGEGMGLSIVRRIIERHRGRIWVESTVNQGSTFYFTLPARPEPKPSSGRPRAVLEEKEFAG